MDSTSKRQLDELDQHQSDPKRTAPASFDDLSTECSKAAHSPFLLACFAQSIADRPYDVALMPPLSEGELPWGKLLQEHKPANAFACMVSTGVRTLTTSISCVALVVMPNDAPEAAMGDLCGAYAYFGAFAAGDGPVDMSAQQYAPLFSCRHIVIGDPLSADAPLWSRGPHHHRVRLATDLLAALRSGKGHPQLEPMLQYLRKHMATGENPGSVAVENDRVLYTLTFDVPVAMTFLRGMIAEAEAKETKKAKRTVGVLMPPVKPGGEPMLVNEHSDTPANAYLVEVSDPAQNLDRSVTDDQGFSSVVLVVTHVSYGNEDGTTPKGEVIGDYAYVGPSRQRGRIMAVQHQPVTQRVIGTRVLAYQTERTIHGRPNVDWFWRQSNQWHSRVRLPEDLLSELRSGRVPRNLDTLLDYLRRVTTGRDGDQTLYDVCTDIRNLEEVAPATTATIAPAATTATIQQAYRPEAETIAPVTPTHPLEAEMDASIAANKDGRGATTAPLPRDRGLWPTNAQCDAMIASLSARHPQFGFFFTTSALPALACRTHAELRKMDVQRKYDSAWIYTGAQYPTGAPAAEGGRTLCREIICVRNGGQFSRLYVPFDKLTEEEHDVLDEMDYCGWDSGVSWADPENEVMALLGLRLGFSGLSDAMRTLPADEQKALWKRECELAKLAITDLTKVRVDRPSACAIDWC